MTQVMLFCCQCLFPITLILDLLSKIIIWAPWVPLLSR